ADNHATSPLGNGETSDKVSVPNFRIAVHGFPCKDVSARNVNVKKFKRNIQAKTGKTGTAFAGIVDLLGGVKASSLIFSIGENVKEIAEPPHGEPASESNLAYALRMLDYDTNQFAFAVVLDPRMFATPVSRGRVWIPAISRKVMGELGVTDAELYDWITRLLDRFAGHKLHNIDSLFLGDSDPYVVAIADADWKKTLPWMEEFRPDSDAMWPSQHSAISNRTGHWFATSDLASVASSHAGIRGISRRELDMLICKGMPVPDKIRRFMELGQNGERSGPLPKGPSPHVPCVCPNNKVWVSDKVRVMNGLEFMQCQGIYYPGKDSKIREYSSGFLRDLAGNAMHT
ncbi:unnamed protein product, partial [Prorocentrum cordatum]